MKTKKIPVSVIILAILWLSALLFATGHDLDISAAIANSKSIYGRVLEVAGEPPAILFTSFNLALMAAYFWKCCTHSKRSIVLGMLTVIGCIGTSVFTMIKTAKYIADYSGYPSVHPVQLIYAVCAALAVSFVFIAIAVFMREETLEKYFFVAWRCVLAAILTFVIIWALKLVWGRVRPRQLETVGGFTAFTPWYLPRGFTGFFSFPSGHTANATVIISSLYYFNVLPCKYKKFEIPLKVLLTVWIALVAFSRVRIGAHYLSDVLFGLAVTVFIVYFSKPRNK